MMGSDRCSCLTISVAALDMRHYTDSFVQQDVVRPFARKGPRIAIQHRAGIRKIERRAMGMSFDRGNKFRRTGRADLIESLSKKYNLKMDQIRRIVGVD